ncbi:MAG: hypothetical protein RLZZ568_1871 [Cyanobacteriota bacterium]|jgi:uncharacterized protein (TIGR04168 family)
MSVISSAQMTIAVVGDIHEQWEIADHLALQEIGVDLVLFVGDFGNESLKVVGLIAELDLPKATIFGNHDAWFTATDWGRKKSPYDHALEDRVTAQQTLLGRADVSYGRRDFAQLGLSVVGSRPFTWGGDQWKTKRFLREHYGMTNFIESQAKIAATALNSPHEYVIFLSHNGPTGLGDLPESICGRDWQPLGGDFGDPDLAAAIATVVAKGKKVPLVTFGHMHHRLRHRQDRLRERVCVDHQDTVYLNAACVPRIQGEPHDRRRNFTLVTLTAGQVTEINLVWVGDQGKRLSQECLYARHVKMIN